MLKDKLVDLTAWSIFTNYLSETKEMKFPSIYILRECWRDLAKVLYDQIEVVISDWEQYE